MRKTHRFVSIGLLTGIVVLTVTGCAGTPEAQATLKPAEADRMYVTLVHASTPDVDWMSDDQISETGRKICKALRTGATFDDLDIAFTGKGIGSETKGALFASAPGAYCPKWSKAVQKWLDAN